MLSLGALAFASPWMLLGLAALPAIWWLLRVTPPSPRRTLFPPLALLLQLQRTEETPAATPWWLLALRLLLVTLAVLALARPLLNPSSAARGDGPLLIVVDDGWTAAADWRAREDLLRRLLEQAAREHRAAILLPTAPPTSGAAIAAGRLTPAAELLPAVQALQPKPWSVDRRAAAEAVRALPAAADGRVVWLGDGVDDGAAGQLAERLAAWGEVTLYAPPAAALPVALLPPEAAETAGFSVRLLSPPAPEPRTLRVRASDDDGRLIGRLEAVLPAGAGEATALLRLPTELRNQATRLDVEDHASAGTAVLLDERWRRRPVGIFSGAELEQRAQPLLSNAYYLNRALAPFSDVHEGSLAELVERRLSVLLLADVGTLPPAERRRLGDWVDAGGVLVRFAGPRLARQADELLPVRLRLGGRTLGGALSWDKPQVLGAFPDSGPFRDLAPPQDVTVTHQVLAEPSLELTQKAWARLGDGTPLVTGERRGQGWLVLFHTTANTDWSNLAISGTFVQMLQRLTELARGVTDDGDSRVLPPLSNLDGRGQLGGPAPAALPVPAGRIAATAAGPRHPPGFYGTEEARRALNATAGLQALAPIGELPVAAQRAAYAGGEETDLMPWLLGLAVLLGLVDLLAVLALRGLLPTLRRRAPAAAAALALLAAFAALPPPAAAQEPSAEAVQATLATHLAYVITGDAEVDRLSQAGLFGLSDVLRRRTSVEPGPPMGVRPEQDELVFFPLLYWPMTERPVDLSDRAIARIDNYLRTGGTILFDTRDGNLPQARAGGVTQTGEQLRRILGRLDVPPLLPVPAEHVLTKAFYLLADFPGRYEGAPVWVEARPGSVNDGVSSVIIGGNDWAAAWATDENGRPLAAVFPGGPRQREMAYRFGVNLAMYTLTGNYKADQVHVPAILERLGQ